MRFRHAIVIICLTLAHNTPAVADEHADLIKQWEKEDSICRGSGDGEKKMFAACDRREKVAERLNKMGWCYGKNGQLSYQYRYHRCAKGSIDFSGTEYTDKKLSSSVPPSNKVKSYDEMLKGEWGDTDYKTCKEAKNVDRFAFYNGSKFNAPEQDCIVLSSKSKPKAVNLKMLCVFEMGEKSKVNADIKFVNDNIIKIDADEYRRCSE